MSEEIRDPVPREALKAELSADRWIREFRGIDIYVVDGLEAPSVMQEIGRIREIEFRREGGGTGKAVDIDDYDTGDTRFLQLVSWDSANEEIVGMYRFLHAAKACRDDGSVALPTARLFDFAPRFLEEYVPWMVELGRSVVNRKARRALLGLFTAWAGLGAIVAEHPEYKFFFGKFTTYPGYDEKARGGLLRFLDLYCPDPDKLVRPRHDMVFTADEAAVDVELIGDDYQTDYQRLQDFMKARGEMIPPLVISYLGLSDTMRSFGTAVNPHFGSVLETAILINIGDVGPKHWKRFVESYESKNPGALA